MNTLLARKNESSNPFAKNDDAHMLLVADSTVNEFPQINSNNNTDTTNNSNQPLQNTQSVQNSNFSSNFQQSNQQSVSIIQNQSESLRNTGGALQDGSDSLVKNDNTDWINRKWRPMMGWVYMATCTADFVVFPILWSVLQALSNGQVTSQWQPLTLQGAGLYHIAMGAVLGIAAYGRTKEKVAGAA